MSDQTILIDKRETYDKPDIELGTALNCKY
jgi:hypothetical protein